MNPRRSLALVILALLGCGTPDAMGQYGQYHITNRWIHLRAGDSLKVFRVKYWVFTDGSKPAVQLEYASPTGTADSVTAFSLLERIWPAFAPYVEKADLDKAIITETVLDTLNVSPVKLSGTRHFGIVVIHDADGVWRVKLSGRALAPASTTETLGLTDINGVPMSPTQFAESMNSLVDSMDAPRR
jgi:hypothetical protein